MTSGVHAIPTRPIFQMNASPSTDPRMTVAIDWTIAAKVTPASPLTFIGLSLNLVVNAPVLFSSLSKNSTTKIVSQKLWEHKWALKLTVLTQECFETQIPQSRRQRSRAVGEEVVLGAHSGCRNDCDDKEPQRSPVSVVSALFCCRLRETLNALGEDQTKGWVDSSSHYISSSTTHTTRPRWKHSHAAAIDPRKKRHHWSLAMSPILLKR
jgi:hypothetical protein